MILMAKQNSLLIAVGVFIEWPIFCYTGFPQHELHPSFSTRSCGSYGGQADIYTNSQE